jgi:hypothetical protein
MVSASGEFVLIQDEGAREDDDSHASALEPVIRDAFERVARREARGLREILRKTEAQDRDGLNEELGWFYRDTDWVHSVLEPAKQAGAALGVSVDPGAYIERSRAAILEDAAREDAHTAVESRVSQWEGRRAAEETRRAFKEAYHAVSE